MPKKQQTYSVFSDRGSYRPQPVEASQIPRGHRESKAWKGHEEAQDPQGNDGNSQWVSQQGKAEG